MRRFTRQEYAGLIRLHPFMKDPDHIWNTYEKWVESHHCMCGRHGNDGKQPYNGGTIGFKFAIDPRVE